MNKTDTLYDNRTSHNTVALLRFSAADEDWAMAYSDIKAVITARDITPVPKTPSFVAGIVYNRGMIITAFDLAVLLGKMPPYHHGGTVLHVMHNAMEVGVLVRTKLFSFSLPAAVMEQAEQNRLRETVTGRLLVVKNVIKNGSIVNILSAVDVVEFFSSSFPS